MILVKNSAGYFRDSKSITQEEYESIREMIHNRPTAPEGYAYRLTDALEWELYELPADAETDEEISSDEALDIILGGEA